MSHNTKTQHDQVTIAFDRRGRLNTKSQLTDYRLRGDDLQDANMISFFVNTFECNIDEKTRLESHGASANIKNNRRGRPRNERVQYADGHPQHMCKHRIYRRRNHNMLPNFVGPAFPRNDDKDTRDLYCACMLMLLKPWRDMQTDLKQLNDTWEGALEKFLNDAPTKIRDILSNIQYFHECETAAHESADVQTMPINEEPTEEEDIPYVAEIPGQGDTDGQRINPMPMQDDIHAQIVVEKAKLAGVFADEGREWDVTYGAKARMGTANDLQLLQEWKDQMERDVNTFNQAMTIIEEPQGIADGDGANANNYDGGARVIPLHDQETRSTEGHISEISELALTSIDPSMLKADQYRAYDIITCHLQETLAGSNPPPAAFSNSWRRRHRKIQSHPNGDPLFPVQRGRVHATEVSIHRDCSLTDRRKNDAFDRHDQPGQRDQ